MGKPKLNDISSEGNKLNWWPQACYSFSLNILKYCWLKLLAFKRNDCPLNFMDDIFLTFENLLTKIF